MNISNCIYEFNLFLCHINFVFKKVKVGRTHIRKFALHFVINQAVNLFRQFSITG
jgi:hypothetical protein